jgi:hypothetical protein
MTRRILLLNVTLVALLGFGASRLRQEWNLFKTTHQPSAIKPRSEILPGLPVGSAAAPNATDWTPIPSRNPFSYDRTDITVPAPADPAPPPKPVGPKPILFGTMDIGMNRLAMLASGQAGNRNSRPVKVGEMVDGWTVLEIGDSTVTVEANAIRETIRINESVQRDHTRTLSSEAVTTVRSVNAPATPPPQTLPPPITPPPGGGTSTQPSGQVLPDGSRVIQTPFGPHVIPKDPPER